MKAQHQADRAENAAIARYLAMSLGWSPCWGRQTTVHTRLPLRVRRGQITPRHSPPLH